MSEAPERVPLEGVTCPRCGSGLASIDRDGADDDATRRDMSGLRWFARYVGAFGGLAAGLTVVYAWWAATRGGSLRDWANIAQGTTLLVVAALAIIPPLVRAWWRLRTSTAGRLAGCHACGHRWRL